MDRSQNVFGICVQYIPRNMHTVFALLCFVVVIHWLIFPYPSGLLHWHCGNLTIVPVPAKQPWWIWINTSCEFIMNDCISTTKQSTTKLCAYFLGYAVRCCIIGTRVAHDRDMLNIAITNFWKYLIMYMRVLDVSIMLQWSLRDLSQYNLSHQAIILTDVLHDIWCNDLSK